MAGNVKGITIEFRGETTSLDKAIRQINKETRDLDRELKQVDKALKFNPGNVELWRQKQQILTEKINDTKEKLELLKKEQAQMDANGVDKNSAEYRKLQREIITAESKLKSYEAEQRKVGNANLRALGEQFQQVGSKIEGAGQKLMGLSTAAGVVVGSLGAVSYAAGQNADEINTLSKKYNIGTKDLQKYSVAADLVDVDVNTIAKSHTKLEKSMSSALKGTGKQAEAFKKLGVSVTDANGELRDGDEVWQETIEALGAIENPTERDATAMDLFGKSAAELNPLIEDGGEAYKNLSETLEKYDLDFLDQETLDAANQFNDELDTMKAIGAVALQSVGSQLAATLAPALEKVVGWVGKLANWLTNLDPKVLTAIGTVAAVVAALAPLLITLGKVAQGVGAVIKIIGLISGPVGIAILVIGALVAAGILLYKNWDTIKAKAIELKQKVATAFTNLKTSIATAWDNIKTKAQTTWAAIKTAITTPITNAITSVKEKVSSLKTSLSEAWASIKEKASTAWATIKDKITGPFEKAKEKLSSIIETIKGWFPINLGNLFSGIKTPHFKLNTASKEVLGKTITYPTGFDVSWYKKGGIFDSPSIVGLAENGAEAVVPLDKFWDKLDQMQMGQNIVINVNGAGDPRAVAEEVKRVLIRETNQRRLAWQ